MRRSPTLSKTTLALQSVRGDLAQSLNINVSGSTTWSQAHSLLVNYFNNAAPLGTKVIYQFTNVDKKDETSFLKKGTKARVKKSKGLKKGRVKRFLIEIQTQKVKSKGKSKTKSKGQGQWTT